MRVLVISQYFWPENFKVNDLVTALRERNHEVAVLTGLPNYPTGNLWPGYSLLSHSDCYFGTKVFRVPLLPRGRATGWRLALNYMSFAFFACVLGPFRYRAKPDVVLVYAPSPISVALPALLFKWLRSAPVMLWVQDLWPDSLSATGAVKDPLILGAVKRLVRFIYRHCDQILVQSDGFVENILQNGGSGCRVKTFPNWAEALYRPVDVPLNSPARDKLPKGFCLMFAGNIGAAQSFETILAAATILKDHPDIYWIIIGDGHRADWVKAEVQLRGLNDRFRFLGTRPPEAMPSYLALADAVLVTLRRNPAFALTIPSKIQSYMACAKPIIASLEGESAKIISEAGAGLVCPPEDGNALAKIILEVYRMPPEERAKIGGCGRSFFVTNFERSILIDRLESWMKHLAKKQRCVF